MNADWKIIAGTLGIFAAGLAVGVVTFRLGEHAHKAPFPMMHEFGGHPGMASWADHGHGPFGGDHRWGGPGGEDGKPPFLTPEFEKQTREFHEKLKAVLDPYQDQIKAILTPAQQQKLDAARAEARERHGEAAHGPARDDEPEGGMRFIGMIIYKPVLERMGRDLALDARQQAKLDALFQDRRAVLLKFLDANPPPTIRMALGGGTPPAPGGPASPPPPPAPLAPVPPAATAH